MRPVVLLFVALAVFATGCSCGEPDTEIDGGGGGNGVDAVVVRVSTGGWRRAHRRPHLARRALRGAQGANSSIGKA